MWLVRAAVTFRNESNAIVVIIPHLTRCSLALPGLQLLAANTCTASPGSLPFCVCLVSFLSFISFPLIYLLLPASVVPAVFLLFVVSLSVCPLTCLLLRSALLPSPVLSFSHRHLSPNEIMVFFHYTKVNTHTSCFHPTYHLL